MTRTLSIVISIGIAAAILVAAPSAWGYSRPQTTAQAMKEDGFDRAVATTLAQAMREDGFDRAVARARAFHTQPESMFRRVFDPGLFRVAAASAPVSASVLPAEGGPGIEWLQIALGFAAGILVGPVLIAAVRLTRRSRFAPG